LAGWIYMHNTQRNTSTRCTNLYSLSWLTSKWRPRNLRLYNAFIRLDIVLLNPQIDCLGRDVWSTEEKTCLAAENGQMQDCFTVIVYCLCVYAVGGDCCRQSALQRVHVSGGRRCRWRHQIRWSRDARGRGGRCKVPGWCRRHLWYSKYRTTSRNSRQFRQRSGHFIAGQVLGRCCRLGVQR